MKIVCDACSAKYSIADDKVKGKVFKIRCKKCSNIIVVRGSAGATEEPAAPQYDQKETRVYDYQGYDDAGAGGGDEAVWHVVIDQEQVGPMTMAEVQQRFSAGQIDADTYIWREGFADWQPLSAVDVFASLVGGGAAAAGGGAAAVANMFGTATMEEGATTRADSGDLFAAAHASAAAAEDDDGSADLFGSGRGAGAGAPAAAPAPQAAAQARLRGERNENSVLFSLGNLAQLASDAPRVQAAAPGGGAPMAGGAPAPAGGEGSGLIDIRSMASAYLGDRGGAKPATGGIGSIDDLPVFSSTAFNEPAVLMPSPGSRGQNNRLLYMLIGLVGVLAIVAVVMVVVVLKGGKKTAPAAVAVADKVKPDDTVTPPGPGSATGTTGTTPGSDSATTGTTPDTTAGSAATAGSGTTAGSAAGSEATTGTKPDLTTTKPDSHHTTKPDHTTTTTKPDHTKPDHTTTTTTTTTDHSTPDSSGCDQVTCLMNDNAGACCAKYIKGGKHPTGGGDTTTTHVNSDLPESLDRGAVAAGVAQVKARVQACGGKSSAKGEVKVGVKVGADGKVVSTSVKNTPDAALGACVASAMAKATFAKTQKGGSFAYPWKF